MIQNRHINISDYDYELDEARIAKYPLPERDASRLLLWRSGNIQHHVFREIPSLLQGDEILYFNNTKVIPARLHFRKETGSLIEIFLLSPVQPTLVEQAMQACGTTTWHCAVGNLKRWKEGQVLQQELLIQSRKAILRASLADRQSQQVHLEWEPADIPFVQVVNAVGEIPIPPYLKRQAEAEDSHTYQTVYGKKEGAVAAPTAGLHFTPAVLEALREKGIRNEELTLHVSAGTFRPVSSENALEHDMHSEQVVVRRENVEALCTGRRVIAVGTTAMRTLESTYWFGVRLLSNPAAVFDIEQYEPYGHAPEALPDLQTVARGLLAYMERHDLQELHGSTRIYIVPGYPFQVCDGLLTNFHQPCSTLLLLIAAFTGESNWRTIYQKALSRDYRFLSYGDSSLLLRD
jgi:S-adenosylmethionine:tRNA ribosyltransferase-isomerase